MGWDSHSERKSPRKQSVDAHFVSLSSFEHRTTVCQKRGDISPMGWDSHSERKSSRKQPNQLYYSPVQLVISQPKTNNNTTVFGFGLGPSLDGKFARGLVISKSFGPSPSPSEWYRLKSWKKDPQDIYDSHHLGLGLGSNLAKTEPLKTLQID